MEKSLKGTKTEQNLLKSFAGESQARHRYEFFASVAKKEGYEQIAAIFMETSNQEKEHAKRFFKFLEGGSFQVFHGGTDDSGRISCRDFKHPPFEESKKPFCMFFFLIRCLHENGGNLFITFSSRSFCIKSVTISRLAFADKRLS